MRLHPDAAIRVLRNELERLAEARRGCTSVIEKEGGVVAVSIDARLMQLRRIQAAGEILAQVLDEATQIEEALAILEAGFEADQGLLPFEVAAA